LSSSSDTGAADTEILLKMAQDIVQFPEDKNNPDKAEVMSPEGKNKLNSAIKRRNIKEIVTAISDAEKYAAVKLKDGEYQAFCQYLLSPPS
jgi:hypothetical protein